MKGFLVFVLLFLFLSVLTVAFTTHRVRVILIRESKVFRVEIRFLFYRRLLYDSRFPVEIKKVNRKNLKKHLKKLKKKNKNPRLDTPFKETLFYFRFIVALLLVLGEENIPRIHLGLNKLVISFGSGDPMRTAILYGGILNLYAQLFSLCKQVSGVQISKDTFSVICRDTLCFDSEFDLSLSLPLFYYFQVFRSFVPDSDRVLTTLKKRRKKLSLRQK